MKVGIIGLGRIGQVHLESLSNINDVEIVCVSDINETVCKEITKKFNISRYTLKYEDLVSSPEVQAVWVCSPSNLHSTHVTACLSNNKLVSRAEKMVMEELNIGHEKAKKLIN